MFKAIVTHNIQSNWVEQINSKFSLSKVLIFEEKILEGPRKVALLEAFITRDFLEKNHWFHWFERRQISTIKILVIHFKTTNKCDRITKVYLITTNRQSLTRLHSYFRDEYRDTNGENTYHPSDSFDSDLLLDIDTYGKGTSVARLDRTQEDLNKYRQRIDANVEQQKEYSDMMSALQQKVLFEWNLICF